ncbi:glycosyltransferase [Levilactobacillus brevis]|uniref:glycosyltransferase family 2 protein n=1 Tax=Levilactobacillus brevis TaxID=1580 RepID=UPI000FF6FD9A|nr:glycosyltransferase family 2 protein [Levilactobacillus brevis]RWZ43010.1 glycosyltransferase [Levilactobacillus brevis]
MLVISHLSSTFVVGYPITLSIIWITGCVFSALFRHQQVRPLITRSTSPFVSILVPAHNESATLAEAVQSLINLDYPRYELILIDDCSQDDTLTIMNNLQATYSQIAITIVTLPVNRGKANALNEGFKVAKGTDIVAIDADSLLAPDAVTQLITTLLQHPDCGAVTGKPVVRNRSTLIGRLQLLEYIGVIDLIKKAQSYLTGSITTVSGVIVAFRRDALKAVGGWNPAVMTEDIDITWRLYRHNWQVAYEPRAICWILVPERLRGLIKQRQRWSRGGLEVLATNWRGFYQNPLGQRFLLLETIVSNLWALLTAISILSYTINLIFLHDLALHGNLLFILLVLSTLQFTIGFVASQVTAKLAGTELLLVPIYVVYYWMVNLLSCLAAMESYVVDPQRRGTWRSPDRGV